MSFFYCFLFFNRQHKIRYDKIPSEVPLVLGSRLVRKAILADIAKQCYTFALTKG